MSTCRWVASDQPRAVVGRHEDDCNDEACRGCQECTERHCRICRRTHADGTCAECLAAARESLWEIVSLCGALPAEAIEKGVESEAAMLWGPATDWERWGHVQRSIAAGRLPSDWMDVAGRGHLASCPGEKGGCRGCDAEFHPLFVLGSWDAMIRDALEHDEPKEAVTIGSAARYIDMQMTYLAGYDDLPFEDMARDLRNSVGHLEAVLHDGEQRDTGAPCMRCRVPLERTWGLDERADGWRCPRCKERSTDEQYRFAVMHLHREEADWLTDKEMELRTGVKAGTVRKMAQRGDVARKRDSGRTLYCVADVVMRVGLAS